MPFVVTPRCRCGSGFCRPSLTCPHPVQQQVHLLCLMRSLNQVLDLFKNNTLTVEQYAQSLLDRVEERGSIVKAWDYLAPALDRIPYEERGPLHGVAIGVKDILNTRDAGALIVGKTTTTEFTVTNPHDPNRTPGGSSCDSAAAVADFQVTLSLGAQTGGSLIRPASYTGVFAIKPTYNAILLEGQKTFAPTFDTLGFFARSIEYLQLLADVFPIRDDESPKDILSLDVSVALIKTPMWPQAGPITVTAIDKAAVILQNWGAQVEEEEYKRLSQVMKAQRSFLREYRVDKAYLVPEICAMVENTANYTNEEAADAHDTYAEMRRIINNLAKNHLVILTPSAVDEAPLGLGDMGGATFNTLWGR
ncbi:amidase signature domain-containing protein [Aspergillus pseudoustus]|uniref:Amidase signature domain-containing protein n=1 Tax=Aspergillus pseudoustus TaxID=1810923 RepID=A0ABR4JY79_9EURO